MRRARVWLDTWEWGCCGDPFTVGDHVTFRVTRRLTAAFADHVGAELAETIDAVESHHEDGGEVAIEGDVVAIHGVFFATRERVVHHPARKGTRMDVGNGVVFGVPDMPERTEVVHDDINGTARLETIPRVPWPPRYNEPDADEYADIRHPRGFVVDLTNDD